MDEKVATLSGYVVSDLHIFGCSSVYQHHLTRLYREVASHRVTVLNGDTFDFKRSVFSSTAETTRHAIAWLQDLSGRAPHSKIFFLLGNHDSHELFVRALHEALPELPNVTPVVGSLRLGHSLFLHGDAVDLPPGENNIAHVRAQYSHAEPSFSSRLFAQLVTQLRLNKVEYLRHSKRVLAERILEFLDSTEQRSTELIEDIYFGHTHVPFSGFRHKGISFHNTGSMIRGLPWQPMEFTLPAEIV